MIPKGEKLQFVPSFENASILRKFTILFLVASIVPMALLYYIYVQSGGRAGVGISAANFKFAMILMVLGVGVGYMSMRSLLKKVVTMSRDNSRDLGSLLGPRTVKELNQGENEIVILSRSFAVVTGQLQEKIKKLKAMYELQKEFTSTVSHELRTPLASIKMALELVASQTVGPINSEQKDILGRAQVETERLKKLIDDILYLSKMEADKLQMNFTSNDIHRVIVSVIEAQRRVAQSRGLYLETDLDPEVSGAFFDSDRIIQVLNNLLSNAIKFTRQGGVTVKTQNRPLENCVLVSIRDTGKGIAQGDLIKLFEKFQQLEPAEKDQESGTGLGLAICREIIIRHSGKIWVESKLGEGSVFNFTLPIHVKKSPQISGYNSYS